MECNTPSPSPSMPNKQTKKERKTETGSLEEKKKKNNRGTGQNEINEMRACDDRGNKDTEDRESEKETPCLCEVDGWVVVGRYSR